MLRNYDAKYILVYTTFAWQEQQGQRYASWAGYGDEGKWMWMARISGEAKGRFLNDGYIDEEDSWADESVFGQYNQSTRRWDWSLRGMKSTVYKLMAWGKHRWCENNEVIDPETRYWMDYNLTAEDIKPEYFEESYFAGIKLSPDDAYGRIVPLICLYKIDWQEYNNDHQT
jgi:hypothetical protein